MIGKSGNKHLFLTGYMGSGKSSVGLLLSKQLSKHFIDLDARIEESEKMSVAKIFKEKGEKYFRNKESCILREIIRNPNLTVIALGGGTISDSSNLKASLDNGLLIYLEASASTIVKRIKKETVERPLLAQFKTDTDLLNFIETHLNSRLVNYRKADFTIDTNEKKRDQIIAEITAIINLNKS